MPYRCSKCGGALLGDGYTQVLHCEFADEEDYLYVEPDAPPVLCNFEEVEEKEEE